MNFRLKKFSLTETDTLIKVSVRDLRPYALLRGPAYVLLRRNERYLAIRGPLDFFTPDDLERLASGTSVIYFTSFVDQSESFAQAGRALKKVMLWMSEESAHPVEPFERSDAMARIVGPLWGADLQLEPFFAAVLVEALCGPLPPEEMVALRDQDVAIYERRLLLSSGVVLLLVLLGEGSLGNLSRIRREIFLGQNPRHLWAREGMRLLEPRPGVSPWSPWKVAEWDPTNPWVERLRNRFARISLKLAVPTQDHPSIFGERGIVDG